MEITAPLSSAEEEDEVIFGALLVQPKMRTLGPLPLRFVIPTVFVSTLHLGRLNRPRPL